MLLLLLLFRILCIGVRGGGLVRRLFHHTGEIKNKWNVKWFHKLNVERDGMYCCVCLFVFNNISTCIMDFHLLLGCCLFRMIVLLSDIQCTYTLYDIPSSVMSLMVTVKHSPLCIRCTVDGLIFTLCSLMRLPSASGIAAAATRAFGGRKNLENK